MKDQKELIRVGPHVLTVAQDGVFTVFTMKGILKGKNAGGENQTNMKYYGSLELALEQVAKRAGFDRTDEDIKSYLQALAAVKEEIKAAIGGVQ